MRKWFRAVIVFGETLVLAALMVAGGPEARRSPSTARPYVTASEVRAVSLRVLQERIAVGKPGGELGEEIRLLGGLARVDGFVVDRAGGDIILFGPAAAGEPPLLTEDFVVALRNTAMKYAELKGGTYFYSDPGCSIDPRPETIAALQRIGLKLSRRRLDEDASAEIAEWRTAGQAPQDVRVMGIPFDTHFAQVMVRADYDMKKIVDGTDRLSLAGFSGLVDRALERGKKDLLQGRPISLPASSMSRFWFAAGTNTYRSDSETAVLEESRVILLTEQEFLDGRGRVAGRGTHDPLAGEFAGAFSREFPAIAKERPIYAQLGNLFRFVAMAKIIAAEKAEEASGLFLDGLRDAWPVSDFPVPRTLPGRTQVKEFATKKKTADGIWLAKLILPSCGGVIMNVRITADKPQRSGGRAALKPRVLASRPGSAALAWTIS